MKICGCGHCADAAERATQFICKGIDDDECALFAFALCCAMGAIGSIIAHSAMHNHAETEGILGMIDALTEANEVNRSVTETVVKGPYIGLINAALDRYHKRMAEEAKLPKDT